VRGVTIGPIESSQQPGRGYGTAYTAALLDELQKLGANAISITPFGRIWSLDSTQVLLDFESPFAANRAAIGSLVAQAQARGLTVLIVPHLWVTEKVYTDCVKCPHFRNCGQYAMVLPLESMHEAHDRDHSLVAARHA
jgi:hypothetical protein